MRSSRSSCIVSLNCSTVWQSLVVFIWVSFKWHDDHLIPNSVVFVHVIYQRVVCWVFFQPCDKCQLDEAQFTFGQDAAVNHWQIYARDLLADTTIVVNTSSLLPLNVEDREPICHCQDFVNIVVPDGRMKQTICKLRLNPLLLSIPRTKGADHQQVHEAVMVEVKVAGWNCWSTCSMKCRGVTSVVFLFADCGSHFWMYSVSWVGYPQCWREQNESWACTTCGLTPRSGTTFWRKGCFWF